MRQRLCKKGSKGRLFHFPVCQTRSLAFAMLGLPMLMRGAALFSTSDFRSPGICPISIFLAVLHARGNKHCKGKDKPKDHVFHSSDAYSLATYEHGKCTRDQRQQDNLFHAIAGGVTRHLFRYGEQTLWKENAAKACVLTTHCFRKTP